MVHIERRVHDLAGTPYYILYCKRFAQSAGPWLGHRFAQSAGPRFGHRFAQSAGPWQVLLFRFMFLHHLEHAVHILLTLGHILGPLFHPWDFVWNLWRHAFEAVAPKVSQERPKAPTPEIKSPSLDNFGCDFWWFSDFCEDKCFEKHKVPKLHLSCFVVFVEAGRTSQI